MPYNFHVSKTTSMIIVRFLRFYDALKKVSYTVNETSNDRHFNL